MKAVWASLLMVGGAYAAEHAGIQQVVQICFVNAVTQQIGVLDINGTLDFQLLPVQDTETSAQAANNWLSAQKFPAQQVKELCILRQEGVITHVKIAVLSDLKGPLTDQIVWGPFAGKKGLNQKPLGDGVLATQRLVTHLLAGERTYDTHYNNPQHMPVAENFRPKSPEDFQDLLKAYGEGITGELTIDASFRDLYTNTYVTQHVKPLFSFKNCVIS